MDSKKYDVNDLIMLLSKLRQIDPDGVKEAEDYLSSRQGNYRMMDLLSNMTNAIERLKTEYALFRQEMNEWRVIMSGMGEVMDSIREDAEKEKEMKSIKTKILDFILDPKILLLLLTLISSALGLSVSTHDYMTANIEMPESFENASEVIDVYPEEDQK